MKIVQAISEWRIALTALLFVCLAWWLMPSQTEATLNCNIASTCVSPNITLMRMSSTTNAHVAIGTSTDYGANLVCCDYVSTLTTACGGSGVVTGIVNLSSTTNAHIETSSLSNYPIKACLRVATGGYASSTIQETDCTGYEETIGSMSSTTNSHMGGPSDYLYKICASAGAPPQSFSFSLATTSVGFGNLTHLNPRYATPDGLGSDIEGFRAVFSVSTNASYGYVISVRGATLSSGSTYIPAIGSSPVYNSDGIGTNQFGISFVYRGGDSSGNGTVLDLYNGGLANYGYAADATTTSNIIYNAVGAGASIEYGVSYLANISPSLKAGVYTTALTYVATAQY